MAATALRFIVVIVALALPAVARAQRVVDLGHALAVTDPSWTGERVFQRKAEKGDGYVGGTFSSDEHFGTHLDAPAHFGGAWTVDRIPVDRLVRPGICISITGRTEDYQLTVADVKAFEAKNGVIPEGAIVMIATGWDSRWPDLEEIHERARRREAFSGNSS